MRPLLFNVHMCDKVTMSVNQWLPCYLVHFGSQLIQNAYTCTHVSAHNFLNIQRICNPKKVLECWEPGLSNHTIKSYMLIVSTVSTLPVHYCIEILRFVSTVSTYTVFDGMVGKPWFSAFQNFFRIANPLNIKKVMGRNMCACICILYRLYRHNIAFEPLKHNVLWSLVSTVSTWDTTQHTMHCSLCFDLCVSTVSTRAPYPLMYTCVIRWQWVWISGFLVI